MLPELNTNGDFIFKIGIGSVIVIIVYFIFNLFSKLREINEKLDSYLTDFKPAEAQEYPSDLIKDVTEKTAKKESNVDLTGVEADIDIDLAKDLTTIEE